MAWERDGCGWASSREMRGPSASGPGARSPEVRKRHDIEMGARTNTVRVMAKPLDGGTLREYLELVARDRPEPSP
jgi:hypothetical protein